MKLMRKDLLRSALAIAGFTLVLGLAYPLVMTGIAQVAFPSKADGSLIKSADGKVIGSTLLARDVKDAPRYFHPRPSATGYSASVTYFGNRGPNQRATMILTRQHIKAYIKAEKPYNSTRRRSRPPASTPMSRRPTRPSRRAASPPLASSRSPVSKS
jgi:K+-transporting ATPase ATPase C chain